MSVRYQNVSPEPFSTSSEPALPSVFDTYLCRDVSNEYLIPPNNQSSTLETLVETLQRAASHFSELDSTRSVERLQLETARVYVQDQQWLRAVRILKPLWQSLSWRREGWWQLLGEVDWMLRDCARAAGDAETLIAVELELLSDCT